MISIIHASLQYSCTNLILPYECLPQIGKVLYCYHYYWFNDFSLHLLVLPRFTVTKCLGLHSKDMSASLLPSWLLPSELYCMRLPFWMPFNSSYSTNLHKTNYGHPNCWGQKVTCENWTEADFGGHKWNSSQDFFTRSPRFQSKEKLKETDNALLSARGKSGPLKNGVMNEWSKWSICSLNACCWDITQNWVVSGVRGLVCQCLRDHWFLTLQMLF